MRAKGVDKNNAKRMRLFECLTSLKLKFNKDGTVHSQQTKAQMRSYLHHKLLEIFAVSGVAGTLRSQLDMTEFFYIYINVQVFFHAISVSCVSIVEVWQFQALNVNKTKQLWEVRAV